MANNNKKVDVNVESRMQNPITRVVELLENVRPSGDGFSALCPAHDDSNPSLAIKEGKDGRVIVKCFAGCSTEEIVDALGLEMKDLFPANGAKSSAAAKIGSTPGLTLEYYAAAKNLPTEFLQSQGVSQIIVSGKAAVRMQYLGVDGVGTMTRMRVSMDDEPRFIWKSGSKPMLYGLWHLPEYREARYICLVEGESDCQTLWLRGFPALGLPGATTWREEWAGYFDGFERIYVVVEPDKGGDAVLKWLGASSIRDRARVLSIPGAKDPSALYLNNPQKFTPAFNAAMEKAIPWSEFEAKEKKIARESAWAKCKDLACSEDILDEFLEAIQKRNVAGEFRASHILYLALTSRVLERPVSVLVTAPSSAGKSYIVESVLKYFPSSAYYALTSMSEKALAYSDEPLKQRYLVLYEGAALNSEIQNYLVRSLLSEGQVRYETVEKTRDGLKSRLIEREGPTGLIMTTTEVTVHPENATRYLAIPVSDSPAQTRRIMISAAESTNDETPPSEVSPELMKWRALQEWIALANNRVFIPYAEAIANLTPPVAVRLRRDITTVFHLIKAHAILHQATRTTDSQGRIIAKLADYRVVRELISGLLSEGVEQTVSTTVRQTVKVIGEIWKDGGQPASVATVAARLGLERSSVQRRVKKCIALGYVRNLETKRGQPLRLVLGDQLPNEEEILPTPEEVKEEEWSAPR